MTQLSARLTVTTENMSMTNYRTVSPYEKHLTMSFFLLTCEGEKGRGVIFCGVTGHGGVCSRLVLFSSSVWVPERSSPVHELV